MIPADIKITADIRKKVVNDGSLSMMAKNVKIITTDGVVTLRGPVETEKEKAATTMSKSIVGIAKSTSQIEVTLDDLQNNGLVPAADISVLMPESEGTPELGAG
jgi:BON domain